jgi:hypothetical protein
MEAIHKLNSYMPPDIQFSSSDGPLTKTSIVPKLTQFAKKHPELYAKNIHKIRELGEELAYLNGHNIGLNDLSLKNQHHIDSFLEKENKQLSKMSDADKKKRLIHVFNVVQDKTMENDNNLVNQAKAKARGNPATASRISAGVVYAVDMNSEPYPFMIKNSLSKGLLSHEQYASGGQARFAAVQSAVSTSEPGAMGKVLIANSEDMKIAEKDCGTRNGIMVDTSGTDAIGRYEAGTNTLVTEQYLRSLASRGVKKIKVRSPITCESKRGVCAMCYGKNSNGTLHNVGFNVGIESDQTMSEKGVQLILSAKHNVAGQTKSNIPTGFKAAKILLNSTERFPGKASVATTGGVVKSIAKLPTGGYNINISGVDHTTNHIVTPKIRVGENVDKGDILTNGIASTADILKFRGVNEARKYLADELDKVHNGTIDKRHFEVIGRSYLNMVKPSSDKSNTDTRIFDAFVPTLKAPHTVKMSTSDKQITKKYLAEPALHFSPGKQVTKKVAGYLKRNGVKSVHVSHSPVGYTPVFKTYEQRPLHGKSFWQSINYRGVKRKLKDSLLFGEEEDLSKIKSDRAKFALGIL